MLIISKNRDYYDTAIGFGGVDKTIVYNRTNIFEPINYLRHIPYTKTYDKRVLEITYLGFIGFCGKVYPFIKTEEETNNFVRNKINKTIYDKEEVKEKFELLLKESRFLFGKKLGLTEMEHEILKKDYFFKYKTPAFLIMSFYNNDTGWLYNPKELKNNNKYDTGPAILTNPILQDFDFYKVFEPFTAHQEIAMYISGVLGNIENKTIEISNKDKILQAGFDLKTSFRKDKQDGKN